VREDVQHDRARGRDRIRRRRMVVDRQTCSGSVGAVGRGGQVLLSATARMLAESSLPDGVTLRDLATMMVAVSDNSATNVLIDRLGMQNVNTMLDSLALTHTRLRRKMMDLQAAKERRENISTPREMMQLLDAIYHGKVLNRESTAHFFKMLSTHKDSFIPRDLPPDLEIADKPGELEAVRNDSGIVFVEDRPYVICVMTAFLSNERDGEEAISKVSLATWRMFDRLSRATEYGRVVSPGNGTR